MNSQKNFNLKNYNSYNIDSFCKRCWFPEHESDLVFLLRKFKDSKPIFIGNGNNIILSKKYYKNDFIILNGCFDKVLVKENNIIEAEAGATFLKISKIAMKRSMSGMEIFYDIPSSIGGAVVMNAGSKDGEIKDILIKVRFIDIHSLEIEEMDIDQIGFEYRNSLF
mgnify:FL=1